MSLPVTVAETQQAIAQSSDPQFTRNKSSFSNWIEELSFAIFAENVRNPSGNCDEYKTVKFGSGDGPMFVNVCKIRKSFFVTNERPSKPSTRNR